MKDPSIGMLAKLAQNPLGSDNEWRSNYVNTVVLDDSFWKLVASRKPEECAEIIARFAKFVQPQSDGCWHWTGSRTGSWKGGQHGQFALYHCDHIYAHRLSYLIFNGPIPKGLLVRHSCDVGYCVQPSHLLVGTQKDNLQDAVQRGRLPKYRAHRKLTSDDVIAMRHERMRGTSQAELARRFGVTRSCVSQVCSFQRRKHLPPSAAIAKRRAS